MDVSDDRNDSVPVKHYPTFDHCGDDVIDYSIKVASIVIVSTGLLILHV